MAGLGGHHPGLWGRLSEVEGAHTQLPDEQLHSSRWVGGLALDDRDRRAKRNPLAESHVYAMAISYCDAFAAT